MKFVRPDTARGKVGGPPETVSNGSEHGVISTESTSENTNASTCENTVMRDVFQDNLRARAIVEHELKIKIHEPFSGLIFHRGEEVVGACIFNRYSEYFQNVEFTCVLFEQDVGIRVCRRVAWYIFKNMNCRRCTAITACSNTKAQTALESIGFHVEGRMREYFPNGDDGIVYGLLRSEQKLLRGLR